MMSKLYKRIPVEEGALTECVGVHVIKWRPEWGKPTYAFVKSDEDADEPAIEKSHLTDADAKRILIYIGIMINPYSTQHLDDTATHLIDFINSLKGE